VRIVWVVRDFAWVGGEYLYLHEFQVKIAIWISWVICCNYLVIEPLVTTFSFWRCECWDICEQIDGTIWEYFWLNMFSYVFIMPTKDHGSS
jgi:hypothetical protein